MMMMMIKMMVKMMMINDGGQDDDDVFSLPGEWREWRVHGDTVGIIVFYIFVFFHSLASSS